MKPSDTKLPAAVGHERLSRWTRAIPLLIAVALAIVLPRLLVLQVSVIDWDESIYALIAQQWLNGHVPYTTVFDHKPMGLYAIFASFFLVFGDNVVAIRLIALVFAAGTALCLARSAESQFGRRPWLGGLVVALYGLLSLTNGGLASNTEIIANFFIALALCLIVSVGEGKTLNGLRSLGIGASLGMAFQVNYLAGILLLGVAAFYLYWIADVRPIGKLIRNYFRDGAVMLLGFFAVWGILLLPVLMAGDIRDYFGLQFTYLSGYVSVTDAATIGRRVIEAALPWWPLFVLAMVLGTCRFGTVRRILGVQEAADSVRDRRVMGWLVMTAFGLLAAVASGYFYQHFFLFALPGLVMVATAFLCLVLESARARAFCGAWLLLMAGAAVLDARETLHQGWRASRAAMDGRPPDAVANVGDYLSARLLPGDTIFVYDKQPVLYFLTRTTPPSRFAFPDFYRFGHLARRFGTSPRELLDDALGAKPRYIVAGSHEGRHADPDAAHDFYARLEREYVAVSVADPGAPAIVYERARSP